MGDGAEAGILALPDELIESIFLALPGLDLVTLSHTAQRFYYLANARMYWSRLIQQENLVIPPSLATTVKDLLGPTQEGETGSRGEIPVCQQKIEYIIAKKLRRNIARSNYKEGMIQHFHPEHVRIGCSNKHLVALESRKLRVWDISGTWVRLLCTSSVNIDLSNPCQNVYQILVTNSIALICFTFGDLPDSSDFQTIQAYDLDDSCRMVWDQAGLLGTQYHVIRLLGDNLYKLDLLRESIEVSQVTRTGLVTKVVLEQPRHSMRMPFGEISASDKYLVIPGKLVPENSPAITCWNIQSSHRQVLLSDRPVCPFRWYQRSAVKDCTAYGLLNRFRLIGWNADSGQVLFSIDLTDSSPGEEEDSFSWLETSQQLILTVHQEKYVVTVLSSEGIHLGSIRPLLPDRCFEQGARTYVEEVAFSGYTAVIRIVSYTPGQQLCCLLVTADVTPFLDTLEQRRKGSPEAIRLIAHVAAEHVEISQSDHCQLIFNHIKMFDVQPLGIKFFDYLYTGERFPDRERCEH